MAPEPMKIVLIEDNPDDVALLGDILAEVPSVQFEVEHCQRLQEALRFLKKGTYDADVILLDLSLPDSQGLDTFTKVHRLDLGIPIVVLTGLNNEYLAVTAMREGAQDYLVKGQVNGEILVRAIRYSVERMKVEKYLRRTRDELEVRVKERTAELDVANLALQARIAELKQAKGGLRQVLLNTIQAMASTVEVRDPYIAGHQRGVAELAHAIARKMGLPEKDIEGIHLAGLVHDLGKVYVPEGILAKSGKLSDIEMSLVMAHSKVGYDILKQIKFPWPIAQMVYQHHERMNGSGYPRGLSGKDMLLGARIIAVADVVEAMNSHRPYRPALGIDQALEEIAQKRGVLYDADVVVACLHHFSEVGHHVKRQARRVATPKGADRRPPLITP